MDPLQSKKRKRSLQAMGMVAAALLLAALATLYSAGNKGSLGWTLPDRPAVTEQTGTVSVEDLAQLWQWSDGELRGGAANSRWELRWLAKGMTEEQALKLPKQLGFADKGVVPEKDESGSDTGILWKAQQQEDSGRLLVTAIRDSGEAVDQVQVVLLLVPSNPAQHLGLEETDGRIREAIRAIGATSEPLLSVKLSGQTLHQDSVERLVKAAGALQLDKYEDEATVIRTYSSPKLDASIRLVDGEKGADASLQIAMQQARSEKQKDEPLNLTIGVPLIAGEALATQVSGK
ncbi:hypothetical protein SAMN05444162_0987 [Paenibacillaceae bacterium GAS479]|nr:hypothetical protein SAMN05444162_0987 [Paenibacillaceae bacterium GAS479]